MSSTLSFSSIPRDLIKVFHCRWQQLIVVKVTPRDVKARNVMEAHNRTMLLTKVVVALGVLEPTWLQKLVVGIFCPTLTA
eukprot:3099925-Amphidinium_carterae.1